MLTSRTVQDATWKYKHFTQMREPRAWAHGQARWSEVSTFITSLSLRMQLIHDIVTRNHREWRCGKLLRYNCVAAIMRERALKYRLRLCGTFYDRTVYCDQYFDIITPT